ncbi:MAG: hypothetical protein KDD89_10515 [Anaerolineales bacterium]|nr:hypothetical protein [Anaerolineales bacterium]
MELVLPSYTFEAVTTDFLFRGTFQPRGEIMTFTNDPRYVYYTFNDIEMFPINKGYQINCIKQPVINVNRDKLFFISLPKPEEAKKVQVLAAKRPVVFYSESFAVRGYLHTNSDYPDNDLLDEARDFFPMSDATIFPLKAVPTLVTRQVPLLVLNRHQATGYHVYKPENA